MTIPENQREVVEFLTGIAGAAPNETHISAVFVGADTVWKLKKAVRLPFLDFTTVASRAHFLRRELQLNGPWAPGLYRDVVGIVRQAGGTLAFGEQDPIEFVLRMAKVPADDFMDKIASDGRLTPALLDELGDSVAHCHQNLAPVGGVDFAAAMVRIAEGNAKSAIAAGLDDVDTWSEHIGSAIAARSAWFSDRSGNGFVRRCHGDLHLGNICLWRGHPVPFDALEFDEALATIDVGYDLAFLLMDLEHRADRAAANRVLNRYMARSGDVQATAGFPVFLSQRAMIRAHVLAAMKQDGAGYVSAALRYLSPVQPVVIAIGGLQGTGKSTVARALAPRLDPAPGAVILRSDEIRKRLHDTAPEQKLQPEAYSEAANIAVNNTLISCARIAAQGGHSVIVDATFLDPTIRRRLSAAVEATGARFFGFWLQAPLAVLEVRVAARGRDASDATVEVLRRAAAADPGPGDWVEVDASGKESALVAVLDAIAAT
jgi:uncharacterized protein